MKREATNRATALIRVSPESSDNKIAAETGLCSSTILRLRRSLGAEFDVDHRIGLSGRPWSR
jgi:hypothetical protein